MTKPADTVSRHILEADADHVSAGPPAYRMPAEWEAHRATWLAWPHRRSDWPGKFSPIAPVYDGIVRALARFEEIHLLVAAQTEQAHVSKRLSRVHANRKAIHLHICPTDRSWIRDSGPIFVVDGGTTKYALDWHFNAWAKYPDWQHDDRVPEFVAEVRSASSIRPQLHDWRIVLEGGSIDVNGDGLLLTTEECLLSDIQQRNPPFKRRDYENVFAKYLGIRETIWLGRGIVGDDTHGHVDDLARFVAPSTVVCVVEDDPADANYTLLQDNLDRLRGWRGDGSRKLEVVPLPMPGPLVYRGTRLPASYANFYIANGVVLVPTFNDPADRYALGILAELFPDREVVGIHAVDLVWGLGTLHCMTQQEPIVPGETIHI